VTHRKARFFFFNKLPPPMCKHGLEARIIAVADVYDAMTSDRQYAKAMSPLEAKDVITKGSGTDFDPAVVKAFLKAYQSGALEVDFTALDMRRP